MDYEKKYKNALELAKDYFKANQRLGELEENDMLSDIFPELKESEDERVRKVAIEFFNCCLGISKEDAIAWFEKRGEQKPTDNDMKEALRTEYEKGRADAIAEMQKPAWSEEDEETLGWLCTFLNDYGHKFYEGNEENVIDWLKSLKGRVQPKHEWSKEDIYTIENIDSVLFYDKDLPEDTCVRLRNWLKSLKDRCTWKPSDKQIEGIRLARSFVVDDFGEHPTLTEILIELEEQLQKIKENKL